MKKAKTFWGVAVLVSALSAMSTSSFGAIQLKYVSNNGAYASVDYSGVAAIHDGSFYTGRYGFQVTGGSVQNGLGTTEQFFCTDLSQYTPSAFSEYTVISVENAPLPVIPGVQPMDAKSAFVSELFARYYVSAIDSTELARDQQAFQLALWELVYEDLQTNASGYSLGAGKFTSASQSVLGSGSLANTWLTSLGTTARAVGLVALSSPDYQDFLYWQTPGAVQGGPVPEPTTLACFIGLALTMGAGCLWRRRSKA